MHTSLGAALTGLRGVAPVPTVALGWAIAAIRHRARDHQVLEELPEEWPLGHYERMK